MDLSEYQRLAMRSDRTGGGDASDGGQRGLMVTLRGLAGEAGSLLTVYKK